MGTALSKSKDLMVHVYTGDRPFAGTDANVKLIIFDVHGNSTNTIELDRRFKDDFERGQVDTFRIRTKILGHLDKTANLSHIELWRDEAGVASDWCVDKIVIENRATNNSFIFPTFRWIKPNYRYRIKHLDTSLPQFDDFQEERKTALKEKRELYQYDQKFEGAPVQVRQQDLVNVVVAVIIVQLCMAFACICLGKVTKYGFCNVRLLSTE